MKFLIGLAVAIIAVIPVPALAAQFVAGEETIRITDAVTENLYVGAGNVTVTADATEDVFVGGGQLNIEGNVDGDLFAGGGNVRVTGDVAGDVRVGGGNVQIEGTVGGELLVFGGSVQVSDGATVTGEVRAFTGDLLIAGTTGGVTADVGTLRLASTARVNGDLTYTSSEEADIAQGATVSGTVKRTPLPKHDTEKDFAGAFLGGSLLWLLTNMAMLLLFVYFLPAKSQTLAEDWKARFGMNLLIGFIFLIVTPIAGIALLVSFIGIPLGIGVFLLYPILLFIGKLVGIIAVGGWVRSLWEKEGIMADWLSALVGLVLITLLNLIPVIGWIASCLIFLAGLGALVRYDWDLVQHLRDSRKL